MPRFPVAAIEDEGVDLVFVRLESTFADQPIERQREWIAEAQSHVTSSGLVGTVVPVWDAGDRLGYLASSWTPFKSDLTLRRIGDMVNGDLFW
jgi:hypothetical protein